MNPKVDQRYFLAISLITVIGGMSGYFCQNDQLYITCRQPYRCGNISGIGYPFYGADRPEFCGYPGFALTCHGNDTLVTISDTSYTVVDINTLTQTLRLARDGYSITLCGAVARIKFPISELYYFDWNITLYYGCRTNQVQQISPSYRINCGDNSTNYYLTPKQASVVGDLSRSCDAAVNVPLDGQSAEDLEHPTNASTSKLQSTLMTDFTVRWSSPDNDRCENCTSSGGICGYNQGTSSFACYCTDREHYSTCGNQTRKSVRRKQGRRIRPIWVLAILIIAALLILLCCISLGCFRRKLKRRKDTRGEHSNNRTSSFKKSHGEGENNFYELPTFSFSSLVIATNNFSITSKLGEGGFGPVYKGELLNGQFVAIKRLSRSSGQGLEEFKNETELIAKLQHKNLVGILGCCIENDEKILVYEYMPNKSLDYFIFEPTKRTLLDWNRRVLIIEGIAQGILYLHQYSRVRIVHRDLKASNILLDAEMKPKISDFGMARIFGGNDLQANTKRIVGTYGYMSPEYAMEGLFSVKSDVFAFGVLMLEIISGKRNTGFRGSDCLSLLGYAWMLWENNIVLDLVDPTLGSLSPASSSPIVYRYIQIGLLCVQESANDRPVMSDVVAMLSNEQTTLAPPKHPAFTVGRVLVNASPRQDRAEICSVNGLTFSHMHPR